MLFSRQYVDFMFFVNEKLVDITTTAHQVETNMPVIRVEMLKGRSEEQRIELAEVLTKEMARVVDCPVSHIQVIISEVERTHWAVGGVLNQISQK